MIRGHYIRDLRAQCGISLREAAAMLSLTPVELGRIERNIAIVPEEFVRKAEALFTGKQQPVKVMHFKMNADGKIESGGSKTLDQLVKEKVLEEREACAELAIFILGKGVIGRRVRESILARGHR